MTYEPPAVKHTLQLKPRDRPVTLEDVRPDYTKQCEQCRSSPIIPITGLCVTCTFGDDTLEKP